MRKMFCLAALWGSSVALADMPTPTLTTANDSKVATANSEASQDRVQLPLHRNGTLFGMLTRNNNMRRRVGLLPHRMNPALTLAAQDHANYMARTAQFSHYTNGGPQGRASRFGFRGGVRENIAMSGAGGLDHAFAMWQNSGAHYASIVSGTTDAGFGYAVSSGGTAYFVGVYATPTKDDEAGETEEQIAKILDEEKEAAEKLAAEKTAAEKDPNVKPASATSETEQKPASQVQPAAATDSASDE